MTIELTEWQARLLIEGLIELEAKWRHINETTEDEDVQADYGNDLIMVGMTRDHLIKAARAAIGGGSLPSHCFSCGVVLLGGRTEHLKTCAIYDITNGLK